MVNGHAGPAIFMAVGMVGVLLGMPLGMNGTRGGSVAHAFCAFGLPTLACIFAALCGVPL